MPNSTAMDIPAIISFVVFGIVAGSAFAGWLARRRLPEHDLSEETKNLVSVSMAVVGTIAALVLGLLLSAANTSFSNRSAEVATLSADILRLDQMLRLYGPEANPARGKIRQYAERKAHDLFPDNPRDLRLNNPATYEVLQQVEELMLELRPTDPRRQWFLQQATLLAARIGNANFLLAQYNKLKTPVPLIVLVVFWLTLLFASFGLFSPQNLVSALALIFCAMAVAGAIGMVLEFDHPFGGLLHIPAAPMQDAVAQLGAAPLEPHL